MLKYEDRRKFSLVSVDLARKDESIMEYNISNKLSGMKPSAIREIFKSLTDPRIIAFAAGNPAAESFPAKEFSEISRDIFENNAITALQYGITEGYPPLRELLKARLSERFGCSSERDTFLVVSGGQQGIELTCKVMCNEGDVVICENPSFIGALNAFRSNGAIPVGVPLEDDGMNIEALERVIKENKRAKLIYTIPTFHNPSGITTSLEKRKKIYELARENSLVIIEDNPYGELRFSKDELPTIKSLDEDGIVVYCGSFSKVLSAGMRVGFVAANEKIASKLVVAKQVEDVHTNQFFQMLCAEYINRYSIDEHIAEIRALYLKKSRLMLKALEEYMPKSVKYTRPEGGLFLWCTLPDGISLDEFVKRSLERFVAVVPGTAFNCDELAPSSSFRLTYATPSEDDIVKGVKILAEVARELGAV